MGCWNDTCGISTLPIFYHDPVRVILLKNGDEGRANGGVCYPDGFWVPASLPLKAKYNDYGGVEEMTLGPTERLTLDFLKLEQSTGALEEFLNETSRGETSYGFVLVHEDIYQACVEMRFLHWRGHTLTLDMYREAAKEYLAKLKEVGALLKADSKNGFRLMHALSVYHWPGISDGRRLDYVTSWLEEQAFKGTLPEEAEDVVMEFATFIKVQDAFYNMRKFWSPQSGKGSQDDSMDGHLQLGQAIQAHVKQYREVLLEESDYDGDPPWVV